MTTSEAHEAQAGVRFPAGRTLAVNDIERYWAEHCWALSTPGEVPEWVYETFGCTTREALTIRYGALAHFPRPGSPVGPSVAAEPDDDDQEEQHPTADEVDEAKPQIPGPVKRGVTWVKSTHRWARIQLDLFGRRTP
jgi:hypothetical protein